MFKVVAECSKLFQNVPEHFLNHFDDFCFGKMHFGDPPVHLLKVLIYFQPKAHTNGTSVPAEFLNGVYKAGENDATKSTIEKKRERKNALAKTLRLAAFTFDHSCRIVFPFGFTIFACFYWFWYGFGNIE